MESSPLPVATSLDEIYTDAALAHEGQRWNSVFDAFQKEYGTPAQKVARAPGRVNIIGPFRSLRPLPFGLPSRHFARIDSREASQASTLTTADSRSSPPPSSATS